ncbi:MAG: threonine synthase [Euryarchaeota archaeon]|nr:threonine synthase [Euryarchaeota archaeon]MDE2046237.1 threonine synthase [Thermoplasmata archaeon]
MTSGTTPQTSPPDERTPAIPSSDRPARRSSLAQGLACGACGAAFPLDGRTACERCFGPLQVVYDLAQLRGSRPGPVLRGREVGLWRFRELLPPVSPSCAARLSVGNTPLRHAKELGALWGLEDLWLKDDTVLPSGSFKDRPASVAVARAADLGFSRVGCASTGNLAAATARAAARLGLPCQVFVPKDLPASKLLPVLAFDGQIVEVDGTYDDANRVANLLGERGEVGLVNIGLRPYYTEGSKTLVLETLEALGWESPDWVGVPLGSGALLAATERGVDQVRDLGWLDGSGGDAPALFGSQPVGCAPIADAFARGDDQIVPVRRPDTIAESLAIGDPASGYEALSAIRRSGGFADAPTSEEVRSAILETARREGLWVEPAGGTVLASIKRKLEQGVIHRTDRVVAFLTGAGWKTPQALGAPSSWARPVQHLPADARNTEAPRPSPRPPAARTATPTEVRAW